jgi:hypothetical protein
VDNRQQNINGNKKIPTNITAFLDERFSVPEAIPNFWPWVSSV